MTISSLLLIGGLGTPELIIILIVVLLLKAMGQGVKSFKDGVSGINESIEKSGDNAPKSQDTASGAVSDAASDNKVKPTDVDKH